MKKFHSTFLTICALVLSGCAMPDLGTSRNQGLEIVPPPNPVMHQSASNPKKVTSGHLAGIPVSGTKVNTPILKRGITSGHLAGVPVRKHKASVQEKSPVKSPSPVKLPEDSSKLAEPEEEKVVFESSKPAPAPKAQSPSANKPRRLVPIPTD